MYGVYLSHKHVYQKKKKKKKKKNYIDKQQTKENLDLNHKNEYDSQQMYLFCIVF